MALFCRYFLKFDWSREVVTIRRLEPLFKFDKWWMSKYMCIEGTYMHVCMYVCMYVCMNLRYSHMLQWYSRCIIHEIISICA